jgi:KDO2-lipid IV(A) lauroyltransferase
LCFPHWTEPELRRHAIATFIFFAKAWVDRGWLWHAAPETLRARLQLVGATEALQGDQPVVVFAPHFVGLDAGWTALTLQMPRQFTTIYAAQLNPVTDSWILAGRKRFGQPHLVARLDGVKPIVTAVQRGEPLSLLPDMHYDPRESLWVPFYGVVAATIPSLSRFAKLGRAKVVPVVTRMTSSGYSVEIMPAWENFPTTDAEADTTLMNQRLQTYIDTMPDQYYWVHKRFKDRPPGDTSLYKDRS